MSSWPRTNEGWCWAERPSSTAVARWSSDVAIKTEERRGGERRWDDHAEDP